MLTLLCRLQHALHRLPGAASTEHCRNVCHIPGRETSSKVSPLGIVWQKAHRYFGTTSRKVASTLALSLHGICCSMYLSAPESEQCFLLSCHLVSCRVMEACVQVSDTIMLHVEFASCLAVLPSFQHFHSSVCTSLACNVLACIISAAGRLTKSCF
jgi:hypothetical protein